MTSEQLQRGLSLFAQRERLDAFDCVLTAAAATIVPARSSRPTPHRAMSPTSYPA